MDKFLKLLKNPVCTYDGLVLKVKPDLVFRRWQVTCQEVPGATVAVPTDPEGEMLVTFDGSLTKTEFDILQSVLYRCEHAREVFCGHVKCACGI